MPTTVPATDAYVQFEAQMADVDNLLNRHQKADGSSGRPTLDEFPLLRASMLLMYAAWEVYVEESLIEIVTKLATQPLSTIPQATKDFIAKGISKDPWVLVEQGWSETLVRAVTDRVRGLEGIATSFGLNNADPKNVVELHYAVLGESPFDNVIWHNNSNKQLRDRLAKFVFVRGEIAHSGRTTGRLWGQDVKRWRDFVPRVAKELDYRLLLWLDQTNDDGSTLWKMISGELADGRWKSSKALQLVCDIDNKGDRGAYRAYLEFMTRMVGSGAVEKGGTTYRPLYRIPTKKAPSAS
ncbi:hypothetical protein BH09ACT5_BH09ACT5_01250 [soil metagenome]